jgi:signal transduction histidine kinase/CheY-like chemotaxis protein
MPPRPPALVLRLVVVALAYFALGRLGLALPYVGTHVTLLWLPTGIAIAAMVRWGDVSAIGVFVGALLANLSIGSRPSLALGIAIGDTAGPLAATWLLRRLDFRGALTRARDVWALGLAAAFGMLASASGGVLSLSLAGQLPGTQAPAAWLSWWGGDVVGVLLAAPTLLAFSRAELEQLRGRRGELLSWCAVSLALCALVFSGAPDPAGAKLPFVFVVQATVVWAAMRFGVSTASLATLLVMSVAALSTGGGRGPFHAADPQRGLFVLWLYCATTALVQLSITALQAVRRRAEDELREGRAALEDALASARAATQAKGAFLANMSHELRTPLNGVLGFAQLALDEDPPARVREQLAEIHRSGNTLLRLLNDLLDFSKIEAGKLELEREPISLAELAQRACKVARLQAEPKGVRVEASIDPALPARVRGDALRFEQILTNLLGNAVKFTDRGEVALDLRAGSPPAGGDRETSVVLSVRDTGIGMTDAQRARLFQPFEQADGSTTRRFGGTGLGLVVTRRLVELMGGTIDVASEPGQGTTFTVTLRFPIAPLAQLEPIAAGPPASTPARSEPPVLAEEQRGRYTGKRVLVVEDGIVNQRITKAMMQKLGFEVDIAEDGRLALEKVASASPPFNLVLMDVHMPEMDGLEATRALRKLHTKEALPIVALTAGAFEDDERASRDAGMNGHVTKPTRLAALARVVGEVLKADEAVGAAAPPTGS